MPTFEVILTHEHTDFDALASLLGAALLFPEALPMLPRNLNRNVREFLALYKNQFPFLQPQELPRGRIRRAILVDARTANYPKGIHDQTLFLVIDHHNIEQALPSDWQVWSEPVGANTTLLVEKLMLSGVTISPVQATLLALGIHEDTGSLTYAGTTHRDANCLAWLLDPARGVNMEVLNHFLHHPLSAEQRQLLQMLIDQSEFLEVVGHTIVIAQADAPDCTGEISTLAHRLRDYHEPDAVFLLINLGEMVQVVARSTTDAIDVGQIARALGGGGHTRAAAAPVHNTDGQHVRDQISALLNAHVRAAITVRHIMSIGRPQMLGPDQTIAEAALLMRRYGHEGFPVVSKRDDDSEELLGVLTRREADRAINHGLGEEPVRRFMQAGQIVMRPTASLHELRKTMIDSNWGQIPVVDDQGQIMGIVTRTDLIKLWDEASLPTRRKDEINHKLKIVLSPTQYALLQLVGEEVDRMNYTVYVVGGFVRDLLLNSRHKLTDALDMDIVIEGDAIAFAQRMVALYGGRIVPHKRFSTAKWILTDADQPLQVQKLLAGLIGDSNGADLPTHLDFVTARTEFYTAPTVLPTVEQSSIKLDLHRRDFTINTLALCLNPDRWGELLDFYGGVNDLHEGVVRVLHSLSFVDDPTRILRAVRYEQRFDFQIGSRTLELLQDAVELLDRVTPARIRHELERILQEAQPEKTLQRLHDLGVLARLHPDLQVNAQTHTHFARLRALLASPPVDEHLAHEPLDRLYWGLLVLRLPAATHVALQERLNLRSETQHLMTGLRVLFENAERLCDPTLTPSQIVQILEKSNPIARALYQAVDIDPRLTPLLQRYISEWRQIHPLLDGHALHTLGLPRGPLYGRILTALRAARLDGRIHSRDEEVALAQQISALTINADPPKRK